MKHQKYRVTYNEKAIRLSPENYITGYKKEHDHHLILCLHYKQTITMFNKKNITMLVQEVVEFPIKMISTY